MPLDCGATKGVIVFTMRQSPGLLRHHRQSSAGERSREMRHIAGRRLCRLEEEGGTGEPGIAQRTAGGCAPASIGLLSIVIALAETARCVFASAAGLIGATAGTAALALIEAVTPAATAGTAG